MKESQRREIVGQGNPLEAVKTEWAVKSQITASMQWNAKKPSWERHPRTHRAAETQALGQIRWIQPKHL